MLILIGKTSSGKNLIRDVLQKKYEYKPIVTYTSRPMRKGEKQDITYHFISKEDFEQKIENGFFTEWKKYDTNKGTWYYGTALEDCINSSYKDVIILTPEGAIDVINSGVQCVVIYVYSNIDTIRKRLALRGDDKNECERRIKADNVDFKDADMLSERIIYNNFNDDIETVTSNINFYYKKIFKEKFDER